VGTTDQTILLVQQDVSLLLTRSSILRSHGYAVEMASGIEEASAKCGQCDLAVVDAQANTAAAIELCEELKRKNPALKVALMIEYYVYLPSSECPDAVIAREAGPASFVEQIKKMLTD
jgi:DNA-binding NtrC family response regulator